MHPNPSNPAKRLVSPVTICIGFFNQPSPKSKGSLVLASDSRISVGSNITNDAKKIAPIHFKNNHAMIAKAGYRHSFNRFEEIFAEKASVIDVTSFRTIASTAEDSIRELQRELLDRHIGDANQRILDSYCEFIIAYFYNDKPYIYTLNLIARIAEPVRRDFVAIGNGAVLADFLLTSIDVKKVKGALYEAAISVIEMCKLHDSSCGGPCRMGLLGNQSVNGPLIIDEAHLASISRRINFNKRAHAALLKGFATKFKYSSPNDAGFVINDFKPNWKKRK